MTVVSSGPGLGRGTHLGYALGSIGTAAFGTVPGLLLLYYLTDVLGVAAGVAGLVVFAPKAWDVVLNPWIGSRSDRTESRWGPRRPWMLAGGLALPPLFVLMFSGPGASPGPAATWVAGGGRGGYVAMAVFVAALLALGMLGAVAGTRSAPTLTRVRSEGTLGATVVLAWRSGPFRVLLVGFVVQAVGIGVMLAGVPYYSRQVLGDPAAGSLLFGALVGPAILVMPLWLRISRRVGKRAGLLAATVVFAAGAAALAVGGAGGTGLVIALVVIVGIGYAGLQMFPLAMLPDVIAADEASSGRRRAGVFTGVWTAAETLGLAVGPGLLGGLLALAGYVSSTDAGTPQSAGAVTAVRLGFSVLPALIVLAGVPAYARYRLDPASPAPEETTP